MPRARLIEIETLMREQIADFCEPNRIPGYLAGVYHDGAQAVVSHGAANLGTGAPMRDDTGFLIGSITKLLTTTLVMRQVERGAVDLDARVIDYLPGFELTTPGAAERIRVRHLLSHTNGIDADLFLPDADGPQALTVYVDELGRHCGALFDAGEHVSYSNGGMIVAGRLLEAVTGRDYHDLLQREVFAPMGMSDSCVTAAAAILRSTAVGHFPDAAGGARRTHLFKLPDSWAPAGSTPICTIADLLAFGRTYLALGVSPTGRRVVSAESIARMRTVAHDMHTPNVAPIGLGWMLMPVGSTTVLPHSGASPGGVALLVVVPDHDLVFAAFGNDARAILLHDQLFLWLLRASLGVEVPNLLPEPLPVSDLARYAGTYRSNQQLAQIEVVDGELEETVTYEPEDDRQARIFAGFTGGSFPFPPRRLAPIRDNLFAPAGMPPRTFDGYLRQLLVSFHGDDHGRAIFRCAGGRLARREPGASPGGQGVHWAQARR